MADLRFEWNERKAAENRKKHGVTFDEAKTVFYDEHGLLLADPEHSESEERFVLLGMSVSIRMLIVCHCYRSDDQGIRLISARRADRTERRQYEERWRR